MNFSDSSGRSSSRYQLIVPLGGNKTGINGPNCSPWCVWFQSCNDTFHLTLHYSPFSLYVACPCWPWWLTWWCHLISGTWGTGHCELPGLCLLYLSICILNWAKEHEEAHVLINSLPCPHCITAILSPNNQDQLLLPSRYLSSCLLVSKKVWSVQTAVVPYKSMGCFLCLFTKACPLCRCGTLCGGQICKDWMHKAPQWAFWRDNKQVLFRFYPLVLGSLCP